MAEEIRMLFLLKSNIEKTYKLEPNYTGISNKSLFEAQALGALKPQWKSVPFYPGSLGNKYGGDVVVKPFNLNEQNPDNKSYSVSYSRVPSEYCLAIIFMMSDAFSQILVNKKPVDMVGMKKDFPNEFKYNEKLCEAKENTLTLISFAKP